ncbi:MAG: cysteine peptidase family C39 domain-containing protein [Planctomycetota bacterium]
MKKRCSILAVIIVSIACSSALADRELKRTEILQIFQTLTAQPHDTWIPAGTVEATHQQFSSSANLTTNSTVIVKYDGNRFYWEINIDSQVSDAKAGRKASARDFNMDWNKKRVFAWDGQRYTMYFRPGNDAIVTENPSSSGAVVNGPLTAGIIPWGYGFYTYQNLSEVESTGIEVILSGKKQIHLTLTRANTPEMVFVLDPEKDYAVLSCSMNTAQSSILKTHKDYQLAAGKWIPTTITIERYNTSKRLNELMSYDYWEIISIDANSPQGGSFGVAYENDAFVEYNSPVTNKPLRYHYSDKIDTELLLQTRLANVSAHDRAKQNCATIAIKYVAQQLGKDVNEPNLAKLVNEPSKDTSLYEMRQFAQELGLHCLAVKTDIKTLKNVQGCQVILHLPKAKHYIVLDQVDDKYAWAIDLDSNKFYYRTKLSVFGSDWSDGTALLVSNEPLNNVEGTFIEVNDQEQRNIVGSDSSGFGTYSCTDLIQSYDIIFCPEPIGGLCGSLYTIFYNRYGCELDEDGGDCTGEGLVGNISSLCIEHPLYPGYCDITGNWFGRYMRACQ